MSKDEKTKLTNQFGASATWIAGIILIVTTTTLTWELGLGLLLMSAGAWYNGLWAELD